MLVIGAGGLGSPVLLYLAAAGVGTIGIVEFDDVELSNLQRQVIHGESDVGRPKAHSAREAIREVNRTIDVRLHEERLDSDNAVGLFAEYDLIVDGTDNFATRYLVNDAAALAGKPYVYGSIYRFEGQVSVFWEDAPDGRGINYRDVYPEAPPPDLAPNCAEGGVLGVLCATVGSIMATEAIKLITGIGEPLLGRLLMYDALQMKYQTLKLPQPPPKADHRADRLRGLLRSGVRGCPTAAADAAITPRNCGICSTPARTCDHRRARTGRVGHRPHRRRSVDSELVDQLRAGLSRLPRDRTPVLYCKTGVRSAEALIAVRNAGFADAVHLQGGIVAWGAADAARHGDVLIRHAKLGVRCLVPGLRWARLG